MDRSKPKWFLSINLIYVQNYWNFALNGWLFDAHARVVSHFNTKIFWKIRFESKWNTTFRVPFRRNFPEAREHLKRQPCFFLLQCSKWKFGNFSSPRAFKMGHARDGIPLEETKTSHLKASKLSYLTIKRTLPSGSVALSVLYVKVSLSGGV